MPVRTLTPLPQQKTCTPGSAGGADSAEALSAWVGARLAAYERRWPHCWPSKANARRENSLRLYDAAIEQLSLAGAQTGILNSVAADKVVRDQAQMEAQRVAQAASALSLNRASTRLLRPSILVGLAHLPGLAQP